MSDVRPFRWAPPYPPYQVRWGDNGHESLFFPGPDATVERFEPAPG